MTTNTVHMTKKYLSLLWDGTLGNLTALFFGFFFGYSIGSGAWL
jgi:hypothetical protein